MSNLPLWLHLLVVLLALRLTLVGSMRLAEAACVKERNKGARQVRGRWLPLRMSNSLIILAAAYCVMICVQHPPFGSSLDLLLSTLAITCGSFLSVKGY